MCAWQTQVGNQFVEQFMQRYGKGQPPQASWSWKPQERVNMTIGIPHVGATTVRWAMQFRQLQMPERVKFITLSGQPVDQARNIIVDQAEGSHILFLDSDVVPPVDVIPRLAKHGLPIVSGLYYRRANPIGPGLPIPGMYKWFPDLQTEYGMGGHRAILQWKPGELLKVDVVGAGCLLVDRRVFNTVPKTAIRDFYIKQYGDTPVNRDIPSGHFYFGTVAANQMSEDFAFFHAAKQYGFDCYVDTSVICDHLLPYAISNRGFEAVDAA